MKLSRCGLLAGTDYKAYNDSNYYISIELLLMLFNLIFLLGI